jgi:carbon storage regulator CsrA
MLVLSRKPNEKILFPDWSTTIQVVSIKPGVVRLGIEAPPDVTVLRAEVRAWPTEGGVSKAPAAEKAPPRQPTLPIKMKALLVEDNPNERELLAILLRLAGVDVDTAGDGADALDYLRHEQRPDVVLLDMALPRCDGPTMLREIRRDPAYAGLTIFAVAGRPEEDYNLGRGPDGVDRWFQKPLDPAVLLMCLKQQLLPSTACNRP